MSKMILIVEDSELKPHPVMTAIRYPADLGLLNEARETQ